MIGIQCPVCKHMFKEGLRCKAFPEGIPTEILQGLFNHNKKHPKQKNDVLFEEEQRTWE